MTILQEELEIMTKYGKLTIPLREIRRIDFGLHLPEGVGQHIDQSIKLLGSETYKERDDAVKHLVHYGPMAYPFLQRASRNPDPEVSQRATGVIKRITEKNGSGKPAHQGRGLHSNGGISHHGTYSSSHHQGPFSPLR